jgi:hypothetical protein
MFLGVQRVRGNEPSHSQMNSHCGSWSPKWTHESSEHDCRGQNPSVQRFSYIIGRILKFKCLKRARMTHLDIWNTNYDQKKGRESNWQFDSWPLKVRNQLNFLAFRQHATYRCKTLDEGYNFALDFIAIGDLHTKLWAPKVVSPKCGNFGIPTWES